MNAVCKFIVLLLLPILALATLGLAAFLGIGALLARWLPLSLFQASALAIAATAAVALVIHAFATMMHIQMHHDDQDDPLEWVAVDDDEDAVISASPASTHKVGRNETCPCGSGIKFKHCCGKSDPI